MRVEFTQTVQRLMATDDLTMFLTGDLGFNAFEGLMKSYGARFINAGVAEQNMVSVAAGLALEGFKPWVYSIAPFLTYRCVEQIRNDVCLHNLPVRIAGNGGGYTYGVMGATHHALEDMATLKALPNMTIFTPVSNNHVAGCVEQSAKLTGPSYMRLGYSGFSANPVPAEENPRTLTRRYSRGTRATVIGIGQGTQIALKALEEEKIHAEDVSIFGIAKFPFNLTLDQNLVEHVQKSQNVLVVEEHYLPGSLAESLKMALPCIKRFETLTPHYSLDHAYGSPNFQLRQTGMTPDILAKLVSGL